MKQKFIYSFAALAVLAMTGCSGDYDDWANPQGYDQEADAAAYGVSVTAGDESVTVMPAADDDINLVALSSSQSNITGFVLRSITVNGMEVSAKIVDNNIVVSAVELSKALEAAAGSRATKTYDLEVVTEIAANLSNGDAVAIKAQTTTGKFTTQPTPAEDEKGYFLLGDFTTNGWDATNPIWMTNNGDGTYTAKVTTRSESSNWYKFYQGSHFVSGDWDAINQGQMGCEVADDDALSGFIVWNGDALNPRGVQTPVIKGQGTYEITIDVKNMTYKVTRAEGKYYIIGNPNNWSFNTDCMFYGEGNNTYSYTTKFTNQWDIKICEAKYITSGNWDILWGGENGSTAASGTLVNTDAGAIGPSENGGWYTFRFDMNSQTYTWTAIDAPTTEYTNISLIGDFNSWGADLDLNALGSAPHNWYARVTIPSDGGLKFRANHDWGTNWGTANVDLSAKYYGQGVANGDNITVPAGTYDVYFNDITGLWNIVAVE